MTLALLVYLAGVITGLTKAVALIFGATVCIYTIYTIGYLISNEHNWKNRGKFYKWPIAVILSSMLMTVVLPSERTMWMMAGAYTAQTVVESNVGKQTVELIELKLQDEIAKLKAKVQE